MNISLPYGTQKLKHEGCFSMIQPTQPPPSDFLFQGQQRIVNNALKNPIASPPLTDLAMGKSRILIIASDHARPVPSRILMSPYII